MKVILGTGAAPVRLAFHKGLFEKVAFGSDPNGKADYNAKFLFPPEHPATKALEAAEEAVAKEKWGAKAGDILKTLRASGKGVVQNGDTQNSAGFEGQKYVSARNQVKPTVIDRNRSPLTLSDGVIYSGCYVIVHINVWAQDNSFGKRINAELTGVQFVRDGDSFGGGVGAAKADEFEALSAEDGDAEDPFA